MLDVAQAKLAETRRQLEIARARDAIAAVFGLTRDEIAWGHKTPIQHIYGQGPG